MQLVKVPALSQHAYMFFCAHYHVGGFWGSTPRKWTKTQASMHPFEVSKLRTSDTEGFYGLCSLQNLLWPVMSVVITGKIVTKMGRYNKYQITQLHTHTLHTQYVIASTWLGDHQGRPSMPLCQLYVDFMVRYKSNYCIVSYNHNNYIKRIAT